MVFLNLNLIAFGNIKLLSVFDLLLLFFNLLPSLIRNRCLILSRELHVIFFLCFLLFCPFLSDNILTLLFSLCIKQTLLFDRNKRVLLTDFIVYLVSWSLQWKIAPRMAHCLTYFLTNDGFQWLQWFFV